MLQFSPVSIMLAIRLSYIAFVMLRCEPFILSFFRDFIIKEYWILSKTFSASIEMIASNLNNLSYIN
jgi:hypothetical protein